MLSWWQTFQSIMSIFSFVSSAVSRDSKQFIVYLMLFDLPLKEDSSLHKHFSQNSYFQFE